MELPKNYKYTKEHEWLDVKGDAAAATVTVRVGITDFAQSELGELVFVDLPKPGAAIQNGKSFCVVESTKAASDVYAPVNGVISAVNTELNDAPQLVNESPYEKGWLAEVEQVSSESLAGLMTAEEYQQFLNGK
jgi:glycine cleavage system H protein